MSLIETRIILRYSLKKSFVILFILLVFDLLLSITFFYIIFNSIGTYLLRPFTYSYIDNVTSDYLVTNINKAADPNQLFTDSNTLLNCLLTYNENKDPNILNHPVMIKTFNGNDSEAQNLNVMLNYFMSYALYFKTLRITFLLTTLTTSFIFYIYALSSIFYKFLNLSKYRLQIVLEKLEISNNLFKAIAGLLAVLVVLTKAIHDLIQNFI